MDLIAKLQETRAETLKYFALTGPELDRTYAPGKWSVRFLLHHLANVETVLCERIQRVIAEPRQVLWVVDQDAWANRLHYDSLPLLLSARIYDAVRDAIIFYARLHYERDGHLEFVHSSTGVRTLKDEFEKVALHNEHHLGQIRSALTQTER